MSPTLSHFCELTCSADRGGHTFAKQKETFIAPEYILTLCRGWRTCLAEPVGMLARQLDE
jgi:hypothetical protein